MMKNYLLDSCSPDLISYGDSFSVGEELFEHELPGFSAYTGSKRFAWLQNLDSKIVNSIREKEKNHAFPKILADLLNMRLYNFGEGGASFERLCIEIYNSCHKKEDLILVELCPYSRFALFNQNKLSDYSVYNQLDNPIKKHIAKYIFNEEKLFWERIRCLSFLKHIKDTKYPNLFVIPVKNIKKELGKLALPFDYQNILLEFSDVLLFTDHFMSPVGECADGHPGLQANLDFAKVLYQYLKDFKNDR